MSMKERDEGNVRVRPARSHIKLAASAATLLLGMLATTIMPSAHAQEPITAPMKGKTWDASIYQMVVALPYVQVAGVVDPNKAADVPTLRWYYVLPQSNWIVDCKYFHPSMGWMYRGTKIQGITDAGGPYDGYYETGFMATILKNGLFVEDVDEICFPGGDRDSASE